MSGFLENAQGRASKSASTPGSMLFNGSLRIGQGDFPRILSADGVIAYEGQWLGAETFVSFDRQAVELLDEQGTPARLLS